MVLCMDRAAEVCVLVWDAEGRFGTLAAKTQGRLQPGHAYIVYPVRFGKVWKATGAEMILMETGEMLYSLELLIKNFNVFEHFGRALWPDAETGKAAFRAICLAKCVVGEVDRTETRFYMGCGNKLCEARAAMDGNCVTCGDEASHPRWLSPWVVDADAASGVQDAALEFKGRSALKKVKGVYLLPNAAQPERVEMNDAIGDQFYEDREMDLIGWKRPMESTEGISSDPVVHVVVWRWPGEEIPESSPVKVFGSTLGSRYDPVHFRDFGGNANKGINVGGGNQIPPPRCQILGGGVRRIACCACWV